MIVTVQDPEAVPWKALEDGTEDVLHRIAALCESSYVDIATGRTVFVFGKSGPAVSRELNAFLDCQSGKTKKKPKKQDANPEHQIEVGLIDAFTAASKKILSTPSLIRWGTDRLHFRNAIKSGWAPEDIEALMSIYFANANNPFIFLKGDVKSFVGSPPRLSVLRNAETPSTQTVAISEGDIDSGD